MKKGILIGIIVVIAIIITGFILFTDKQTNQSQTINENSQSQTNSGDIKEFSIIAKNWEFQPETITVNEGDTVRLSVESVDVTHGISIPEFGINENLEPGKTTTIEFIADKKGNFPFFCSVYCGSGHGNMRGSLIVE